MLIYCLARNRLKDLSSIFGGGVRDSGQEWKPAHILLKKAGFGLKRIRTFDCLHSHVVGGCQLCRQEDVFIVKLMRK